MKRKRALSLAIEIPRKRCKVSCEGRTTYDSSTNISPQYTEFVSNLMPIGKTFATGSTSMLTLLKDPQGRHFVSKRIKTKSRQPRWVKTTEMLYSNEIRALSATVHCPETPKLVAWKVADEPDSQIVMEYIDAFKMKQGQKLPGNVTAAIAFFILRALKSLHTAGFLHRDIKPENILISRDGRVKLVDFGLCSKKDNLGDDSSSQLGTKRYMAPELLSSGSSPIVDYRSDVWSLGISLIEWILGYNPVPSGPHSEISLSLAPQKFLDVSEPIFEHIRQLHGDNCTDFLQKCVTSIDKRQSAAELLSHPWILENIGECLDETLRRKISHCLTTLELGPSSFPDF